MNNQIELFNKLVELTKTNEAFYKQEFKLDDSTYWIFNYRLATYTDFLAPGALWCRGTMFEVTDNGEFVRLASLPMPKFWNLNENPSTMNLDLDQIDWIEVKSDGSLMSTYIHNGELRLKSKGSLFSEQAIDAMKWLDKPENEELKTVLFNVTDIGYTVNCEYVSIKNRIVLSYPEERLIVLNVIDNFYQGQAKNHIYRHVTVDHFKPWIYPEVDPTPLTKKEFIESVPDMVDDIEGFVFVMKSGQLVKIKTKKYVSLHNARSSVTNPRRLFECVLDEAVDDLRSMFATDQVVLDLINATEEKVSRLYNHMIKMVEEKYEENKHLDRKSFAIKMQGEVEHMYFGLIMNLYVGKTNDYKEFMKKRYKELGFYELQRKDE